MGIVGALTYPLLNTNSTQPQRACTMIADLKALDTHGIRIRWAMELEERVIVDRDRRLVVVDLSVDPDEAHRIALDEIAAHTV